MKLFYRIFKKNKMAYVASILSMSIGLACVLLISTFYKAESSYDQNTNSSKILRITDVLPGDRHVAMTPSGWGPMFKSEYKEVDNFLRVAPLDEMYLLLNGEEVIVDRILAADSSFFTFFPQETIEGNEGSIKDLNSIIITESLNSKLFGNKSGLGRTIELNLFGEYYDMEISQIVKDPIKTHLPYDAVFSILKFPQTSYARPLSHMTLHFIYNYILINTTLENFAFNAKEFVSKHIDPELADRYQIKLQELNDIYLNDDILFDFEPRGNRSYLNILLLIGFFILLVSCVNYVNITTAQNTIRLKEITVKKIFGASNTKLYVQLLSEMFIALVIAFALSLLFIQLALPVFESITGVENTLKDLLNGETALLTLAILLCTFLLCAIYPAIQIAKPGPVGLLMRSTTPMKSGRIRKGLVIFQLLISSFLLFCTLTITSQINFIKSFKLGFEQEDILTINTNGATENWTNEFRTLKTELLNVSQVSDVTVSSTIPGDEQTWSLGYIPDGYGDEEPPNINTIFIDDRFIELYDLSLIEGRNFNLTSGADSMGVIINKKALELFQTVDSSWENPIGKNIARRLANQEEVSPRYHVIGVIENFNYQPLDKDIDPLILKIDQQNYYSIQVKTNGLNTALINTVKNKWSTIFPEAPFSYSTVEDVISNTYSDESKFENIFKVFSALALLIAMIGVFGLITFDVKKSLRNICIRRVLGASRSNILISYSSKQLIYVGLALVLGIVSGIYYISDWLEGFTQKVSLGGSLFLITSLIIISIVLVISITQILYALKYKPTDILKEN